MTHNYSVDGATKMYIHIYYYYYTHARVISAYQMMHMGVVISM